MRNIEEQKKNWKSLTENERWERAVFNWIRLVCNSEGVGNNTWDSTELWQNNSKT